MRSAPASHWAAAALLLAISLPRTILAAEIQVTTSEDTLVGPGCSLRAALRASDLDVAVGGCSAGALGLDQVLVPAGHYTLTPADPNDDAASGDLDVIGPVEILGAGTMATSLTTEEETSASDRIFEVASQGLVSLTGATLRGGSADRGGAILVAPGGELTLSDCLLSESRAAAGGALYLDDATATIERCEFRHNQAGAGGAVFQFRGLLRLSESLLQENEALVTNPLSGGEGPSGGGGAIATVAATTVIETSELVGNRADDTAWGGGGILVQQGDLLLSRSTLLANSASDVAGDGGEGGPDYDQSGGGAIGAWGSAVRLENVTLSGNFAETSRLGGGAILSIESDVALHHSTLWNNSATGSQEVAGALAGGSLSTPVTHPASERSLTLAGSILGDAIPAECLDGTSHAADVSSSNLIDDPTCNAVATTVGSVTGLELAIADNGGPSRTHRLLSSSNAIDAAGMGCSGGRGLGLATDQRGVARPQDGLCDMGAVERTSAVDLQVSGTPRGELPEPGGVVAVDVMFRNGGFLPVRASLELGEELTGLGTCGPLINVAPGSQLTCQIELTVIGNAGPLTVSREIEASTADTTGVETLTVDLMLTDVPPSAQLAAFAKPSVLEQPGGLATVHVTVVNPGTAESVVITELAEVEDGPLAGDCAAIVTLEPGQSATCAAELAFLGQAGDQALRHLSLTVEDDEGNATVATVAVGARIEAPGSILLVDCFESGDLSAWSTTVP